ncbi:MAG: hypothetical protein UU34_C0003G0036 [Candidatus Curtissbacteria bacterium GW2011_GWA1_41_11]|uniref:Uncharacterized protein n=1 Tax=Candidatus Curtissbacteria bacterium GW2011_GWA1_41_11 TaxID=1618409 RepID=A0A0G0UFM8_9BACT|nr:MAG: hypothetical protein UU34_C0003G0036 [Candidatus Curtissbacteria bacterium GW2011_GWA1_41_11]
MSNQENGIHPPIEDQVRLSTELAKHKAVLPVPHGDYYFDSDGKFRPEIAEKAQQLREGKY